MRTSKPRMPGDAIRKLFSISSAPIGHAPPALSTELLNLAGTPGAELLELLRERNGFYAFESALHILPANAPTSQMDIERWNDLTLWKGLYGDLTKEFLFFGQDIFANQFGILRGEIHRFNPETGEIDPAGSTFEEWAQRILDDYEYETGHTTAREWQELHGPIPTGMRLFPKIPFVMGGAFNVENLYALEAVEGLRYLAEIYRQIKDAPDRSRVELRVVE